MKILVIKPSSLGDIVHGLQVVESLRAQKPEVEITWVVRSLFAPIVEASGIAKKVILFERKEGIAGWWKVLREIRRVRYDWVLDMQGLARSALWTRFAKARRKVGRADGREFAPVLIREKVLLPPRGKQSHAVEILLQYLKLWELPPQLVGVLKFEGLEISGRETLRVDSFLRRMPEGALEKSSKLWAVFPESRRIEKEWPYLYQACQEWLSRDPNLSLVALASKEHAVPASLSTHPRWLNLMGKTTLPGMIAWIQAVDGVVTNDSGPMHIAAAMNKPLLALFGATSAERFGPYPLKNPKFQVLTSKTDQMSGLSLEEVLASSSLH